MSDVDDETWRFAGRCPKTSQDVRASDSGPSVNEPVLQGIQAWDVLDSTRVRGVWPESVAE